MTEDARVTLGLLADHESAIGDLYSAYATVFPSFRDLWSVLGGEEKRHSHRLNGLRDEPAVTDWLTPEVRRRLTALRSSTDYLKVQTSRAHEGGLTSVQALAVAKDIEDALIERLELLPDAPQCAAINRVLVEIKEETNKHRQRLREALQTERRSGS